MIFFGLGCLLGAVLVIPLVELLSASGTFASACKTTRQSRGSPGSRTGRQACHTKPPGSLC